MLGWLSPPKVSFLKLTQTKATKKLYDNCHVIQDLLVPMTTLEECIIRLESILKIYPIWLCGFVLPSNPGLIHPKNSKSPVMFVDVGLYGTPAISDYHPIKSMKKLEKMVKEVNG